MNELIQIVNHIHNILSCILIKYNNGTELTETEDEVLTELYITHESGHLKNIEELPITENIYLKHIIMSRTPKQNVISEKLETSLNSLFLNTVITNIDGKPFSTGNKEYVEIARMIELGADIKTIHEYCIKKGSERDLTVREVIKTAVLNAETDKKTPEDKFDTYNLAIKIENGAKAGEISDHYFSDEERIQIKKSTGQVWGIEIVGFIWNFFHFSK